MTTRLLLLVAAIVLSSEASAQDRRAIPSSLSSGYYAIDSDDNVGPTYKPTYAFVDTLYDATRWRRIARGPRTPGAAWGYFFFNPTGWANLAQMDTADNSMAGPIPIGFPFKFYGISYDSVYISSNGFIGFRPWAEAVGSFVLGSPDHSYVARNIKDLNASAEFSSAPPAIVAALWSDLIMSAGDTSRVFVRTNLAQDTFMVNYYNFRLKPGFPNVGVTGAGSDRILIRKLQIILAKSDSSIQINYGPFGGAINQFPPILAARLFSNNVSIGTLNHSRTEATSVLHSGRWDANTPGCASCNQELKQPGGWAIKFSRQRNIVQAKRVDAPVRNYEICLGETITPKATFTNLNSSYQSFVANYRIRNVVTGINVYTASVNVTALTPGKDTTLTFTAFTTNPNTLTQLGTLRATAFTSLAADSWPHDDSVSTPVFGVRRIIPSVIDASNNYRAAYPIDLPDPYKWMSMGAEVVEGDSMTYDPPGPRDLDGDGFGSRGFRSPVIRLDRYASDGIVYSGVGGDTIASAPINLEGRTKAFVRFSYQRGGRLSYAWLHDAEILYGPEHTVINNLGNVIRYGDSLTVEFKKQSSAACNPSASDWVRIYAIDGGRDTEFETVHLPIENYNDSTRTFFNSDFRVRFRLKGAYNGAVPAPPADDADPWYIDNITIAAPTLPEISIEWVRAVTPYTKLPASQALLPIYVKLSNTRPAFTSFPVMVEVTGPDGEIKYSQRKELSSGWPKLDTVLRFPEWRATNATYGNNEAYTIRAWINDSYDSYPDDNATHSTFFLPVNPAGGLTEEFAYDDAGLNPQVNAGNDWPTLTGIPGKGVGFDASSGSFAVRFTLAERDTLYGVRIYFSGNNAANDPIRIGVHHGSPESNIPGDTIIRPGMQSTFTEVRRGDFFNKFWAYYFPKPIVLEGANNGAGHYWLAVSQLSLDNMNVGADISRGGAMLTRNDNTEYRMQTLHKSPYGTQVSPSQNTGDLTAAFALRYPENTGTWLPWMPSNATWPTVYPSNTPLDGRSRFVGSPTYHQAGSYLPMIRPLVSRRMMLPVEFAVPLRASELEGTAVLSWTTAEERNNAGFYIERRNSEQELWQHVGFVVSSVTNSGSPIGYSFVDESVVRGIYYYRLVQTDNDGAQKHSNTAVVTIRESRKSDELGAFPNPFITSTSVEIQSLIEETVSLSVYDVTGKLIRTLPSQLLIPGTNRIVWDGNASDGQPCPFGSFYIRVHGATSRSILVTRVPDR